MIIFCISCQWYHYCEYDEVVNVQRMIVDIFEKELNQQQSDEDEDTGKFNDINKYIFNEEHGIPDPYHKTFHSKWSLTYIQILEVFVVLITTLVFYLLYIVTMDIH